MRASVRFLRFFRNPQTLWKKYLLALSLTFIAVAGTQLVFFRVADQAKQSGARVEMLLNQRDLARQVLAEAMLLQPASAPDGATLSTVLSLLDAEAARLANSEIDARATLADIATRISAEARQLAEQVPGSAEAGTGLATLGQLIERDLGAAIDSALAAERSGLIWIDRLVRIEILGLIGLAGLMLLQGLLIFLPAQVSMDRTFSEIGRRKNRAIAKSAELEKVSEQLTHHATHDPLTGLANRKKLGQELALRLEGGDLEQRKLCLFHIDLDHFKEVNDTLGHLVGDGVLKVAADRMRGFARGGDLVARIGGDEFIMLVEFRRGDDASVAQIFADGVIEALREPMQVSGADCQIGGSIGYAFASPDDGRGETLIGNADIALYESKRCGRGRATPFTESMRKDLQQRRATIRELDQALKEGQIVAFLQPQVALGNGEVVGFEALARWQHPLRGTVSPGAFIEIAEEIGVIEVIDEMVMLSGLDCIAELHRGGWDNLKMAVNVSAKSLRNANFAQRLIWEVEQRGISPSAVVIELLQATLIEGRNDRAVAAVEELTRRGFEVHIDDFGTGYSSLESLSSLELSGLKIDRSIVCKMEEARTLQVMEAICGLARGLGLKVVAEGVESQAAFAALEGMGCHNAQGFGIGYPMPREELVPWLLGYAGMDGPRLNHA